MTGDTGIRSIVNTVVKEVGIYGVYLSGSGSTNQVIITSTDIYATSDSNRPYPQC